MLKYIYSPLIAFKEFLFKMNIVKFRLYVLIYFVTISGSATAQEDSINQESKQINGNYILQVSRKISDADEKLTRRTKKVLRQFEREEERILRILQSKDSSISGDFLRAGAAKIDQLETEFLNIPDKVVAKLTSEYNAYLDTLKTTFKYLQQKGQILVSQTKQLKGKLEQVTGKINVLEGKFQKTAEIKNYLRERKQFLRQYLEKYGISKEIKKLDKVTYYYSEYIKEYKEILSDRRRLERKAMGLLYSIPVFKKFISENNLLASLFKFPGSAQPDGVAIPTLTGLQTRASVNEMIQTAISAGGPNAYNQVRQQIQDGQAQLSVLKNKIAQYGSADAEIPTFKPNSQKTKSFLKRLEYGANIQFGKSNQFMPTTSDIALSLGYKINDKSSIGIGASYKLGLGSGWNNIRLTNEGLGLRSYIDWKIKGGFYLSGGYEQNYNSQFKNIGQLKQYSSWQAAGLVGLTKKTKLKGNKSAKLQIMYDFLSYSHVPATQPFIFRTGFSLK